MIYGRVIWPWETFLHVLTSSCQFWNLIFFREVRGERWLLMEQPQSEIVFRLHCGSFWITRKENNWKTEEALERAVVTLETERIKGSSPWCLWWWWSSSSSFWVWILLITKITRLCSAPSARPCRISVFTATVAYSCLKVKSWYNTVKWSMNHHFVWFSVWKCCGKDCSALGAGETWCS